MKLRVQTNIWKVSLKLWVLLKITHKNTFWLLNIEKNKLITLGLDGRSEGNG